MTTFQEELRQLGACHDACEWVGERTREQAWSDCERVDWMLWYAMRAGASHKDVVTCACRFARISLAHTDDPRVLACIETVEAWVRGEATDADVVGPPPPPPTPPPTPPITPPGPTHGLPHVGSAAIS